MKNSVILECDLGNTRCKWRAVCDGEVLERGSFIYANGCRELTSLKGVARIRVASVVKSDILLQFTDELRSLNVDLAVAKTSAEVEGVVNAYADPSRLGVDRWLSVVAAYKQTMGPVLVLDAGSALTADLVDGAGLHLGGYILPGIALMQASLLSDTSGVRFESGEPFDGLDFGGSTAEAVRAGVLSAHVGSVSIAVEQAKKRVGADLSILLTGGDALLLKAHLPDSLLNEITIAPELVLDGLQWLLP